MSFLYPLFLIAGLSLAIPVLIHLFNLRRYKTVLFPHTRFLKSIQLKSQKQSQLKYKWLLALRLLFLGLLILAFAQPFFNDGKKESSNRLQVIYIDNSGSMGVKDGARNLFEKARDAARNQVHQAMPGTRFLLLTNDKPISYQPLPADKILAELNNLQLSAHTKPAAKTLATIQSIMQSEVLAGADVYYYSDFQRSAFPAKADAALLKNIRFYGLPVQNEAAANIYIDTAYLDAPVLQTGQQNRLIVHSRAEGKVGKEAPVLQLAINGQVKTAATLNFPGGNERIDTLNFEAYGTGWQQIALTVNDAAVRFDDTFRIAARSVPALSVLVLNEGQPNPYIQAAFRAYNGFNLGQSSFSGIIDANKYNLVILNGITNFHDAYGKAVAAVLEKGGTVCMFPGRNTDVNALNPGLKQIGDIQVTGIDTSAQAAATLQQGSDLVKNMFERIPDNVQLPVANWHYIIQAGLSANEQSVLSFRSGDPFLAKYTPARGQFYLCATAADLQAGSFTSSYFFVPFLYQMAMQSGGSGIYALTLGKDQPAFVPVQGGERNMIHLYGHGVDAIPPQRPAGTGVEIFADRALQQPGFYTLYAAGSDSATIALNTDRSESVLQTWTPAQLKSQWSGNNIKWLETGDLATAKSGATLGSFPLWKVCAILAVLMLAAETFVLAGGFRKKTMEGRPADSGIAQ